MDSYTASSGRTTKTYLVSVVVFVVVVVVVAASVPVAAGVVAGAVASVAVVVVVALLPSGVAVAVLVLVVSPVGPHAESAAANTKLAAARARVWNLKTINRVRLLLLITRLTWRFSPVLFGSITRTLQFSNSSQLKRPQ